jgi:hypothetical protein
MSASDILLAANYCGPAIGALCFVLGMSRVPESARRTFNAIFVAGTCGAYPNGGFGKWELINPIWLLRLCTPVSNRIGSSGIAWLMHAAWDLAHHFWGQSDLALYADVLLGLHDLRLPHRDLVPNRRIGADQAGSSGA